MDVTGILYVVDHNLLSREVRLQHVKADNATLGHFCCVFPVGIHGLGRASDRVRSIIGYFLQARPGLEPMSPRNIPNFRHQYFLPNQQHFLVVAEKEGSEVKLRLRGGWSMEGGVCNCVTTRRGGGWREGIIHSSQQHCRSGFHAWRVRCV